MRVEVRAWNYDTKSLTYWNTNLGDNGFWQTVNANSQYFILMLGTGYKEIYDKDILENEKGYRKIIRYIPEKHGFFIANVEELKFDKNWNIWNQFKAEYIQEYGFKKVGNEFENPELLELK